MYKIYNLEYYLFGLYDMMILEIETGIKYKSNK